MGNSVIVLENNHEGTTALVYRIQKIVWVTCGCQTFELKNLDAVCYEWCVDNDHKERVLDAAEKITDDTNPAELAKEMILVRDQSYVCEENLIISLAPVSNGEYAEVLFTEMRSYDVRNKGRESLWIQMCGEYPDTAAHLPHDLRTQDMALRIVQENAYTIQHLPIGIVYMGLVEEAVRNQPEVIDIIPKERRYPDLWLQAMDRVPSAARWVTEDELGRVVHGVTEAMKCRIGGFICSGDNRDLFIAAGYLPKDKVRQVANDVAEWLQDTIKSFRHE